MKKGLISQPIKPENGYRLHNGAIADKLRFIAKAKALGFTLKEISSLMPMENNCIQVESLGGVWVAPLSCTAYFPALGSLASALGLGFLSPFEGIAVNTLLPIFATLALIVNIYNWYPNKSHIRGPLSIIGPVAVLLTLYPLWRHDWSTYLFYFGISLMVGMSVLDIVKPTKERTCKV
jgi:mercuric ion transport protein